MKKLKDLLKESYVWERKFGEKLPTLADVQKKKSEGKLTETNFDKVKLPAVVDKWVVKLVDSVKSANLNRIKRSALLYKIIDAMGMSPQQLMGDIAKIKKELGEGKLTEAKYSPKEVKNIIWDMKEYVNKLVKVGEDYEIFQNAKASAKALKKIQKLLKQVG